MFGPLTTISFDDGYLDTYKYAVPYLNKKNIRSTFAVPAGLVNKKCENRPVVSWADLKKMQRAGHEIASHTMTHADLSRTRFTRDPKALSELVVSRRLIAKKLKQDKISFVYPYLETLPDKNISAVADKLYYSSRISSITPIYNALPVGNSNKITGYLIQNSFPLNTLMKMASYAAKNRKWLILVYHLIGKKNTKSAHRNAPYRFFTHIDDFKKQIDLLLSTKAVFITQSRAVSLYGKRSKP